MCIRICALYIDAAKFFFSQISLNVCALVFHCSPRLLCLYTKNTFKVTSSKTR